MKTVLLFSALGILLGALGGFFLGRSLVLNNPLTREMEGLVKSLGVLIGIGGGGVIGAIAGATKEFLAVLVKKPGHDSTTK